MQLAQWIRGSCTEAIQHLLQARPEAETYGIGREFAHSKEGWRKLIRAAWINRLLERKNDPWSWCWSFKDDRHEHFSPCSMF